MNLQQRIRDIQRHVGVEDDGIFGPRTAAAVLQALNAGEVGEGVEARPEGGDPEIGGIDPRSARSIETLDPKAQAAFEKFARLAEATAAAMGCEYKMISGHRTWKEQSSLYAKGRTTAGPKVTNARAGYSWHNFGVAADFGVFRGRNYLDASDPTLARRVHVACAAHAEACGLSWGGNWRSFQDIPHFQLAGLPASPRAEHRKTYQAEGSIL